MKLIRRAATRHVGGVLVALALSACLPAFAQDLDASYEAARKAASDGKTAESINLLEPCMKVAEQKNDLPKRIMIGTLLAAQYDSAGRLAEAESLFAGTTTLATGKLPDRAVASIYQYQVRHYLIAKNAKQASVALEQCIKLGGKRDEDKGYGDFLSQAGNVYDEDGKFEKAMDFYKQSEEWLLKRPADKEIARSLSSTLTDMAMCYSNMGNLEEAESRFKRSLQIGEEAFGKDYRQLYKTHNSLAILYIKKEQYARAVEEFDRALEILAKSGVTDGVLVERIKKNRSLVAERR